MYDLANEEYVEKQKKSLEKKERQRQKAEMMRLVKEKAQCEKEEQEWIEREKAKEEAERLAKEQREKEEQIRLKVLEKQKLLEQEAKEAFGKFLPINLINISSDDESSEDEEETKEDENKSKTGTVNGNKDLTTFNPVKLKKEKIDPELDIIATPPPMPEPMPEETNTKEGLDSDKRKKDMNDTSATAPVTKIKKEPENGETNIPPAQPDVPDSQPELQVQNIRMDPRSDQIESKLTEIGALVVDEDILYALHNLKDLGKNTPTPISGNASTIKQESHESEMFNSPAPPGRVFGGMKQLSSDAFAELMSSAKRNKSKTTTPNQHSTSGSPGPFLNPTDMLQAQAEAKGKSAITADNFIRKKKITDRNHSNLFDSVAKKNRDVIQFEDGPQSFYWIITFYTQDLNFMPEDVRHKKLKGDFFKFIMKNVEYTKVTNIFLSVNCISN